MTDTDDKELAISLPGEWALRKAFGPVFTEMGDDFRKLYAAGRDRILSVAYGKIDDKDDGKQPNLRVARDVMWNGAFADDAVCAEYFGGILASSRTEDGKDDSSIQFVDVIKSLSSTQLCLHYLVYNCLNKVLSSKENKINVGLDSDLQQHGIWLSSVELLSQYTINIGVDVTVLFRQGLIGAYETNSVVEGDSALPYTMMDPTTFGVLLYASAHNRMDTWSDFAAVDFGNFRSIPPPRIFAESLETLRKMSGVMVRISEETK